MVAVGVQYDDTSMCEIDIVPKFLQVGGGIMLGFLALYLFCGICWGFETLPFIMYVNNACSNNIM